MSLHATQLAASSGTLCEPAGEQAGTRRAAAHKVLLPIDASVEAQRPLEFVLRHRSRPAVHLLNVQEEMTAENLEAAERVLAPAAEVCRARRVPFDVEVAFGPAEETISRVARLCGCTMVAMARGRRKPLAPRWSSAAYRIALDSGLPVAAVGANGRSELLLPPRAPFIAA